MAKQASRSGQAGATGESYVQAAFNDLDWGPIPVGTHDTGTDFYVQVRDKDLFELGLLLGVQVKNEKSYFKPRKRRKALGDTPAGWSYLATQDDANYWLDHAVPHILVLYDRYNRKAYWTHVTRSNVQWTRKAAKIWVPAAQELSRSNRDELLKVATQQRPASSWSGSSWESLDHLSVDRRLRYALLVPRIAAPHPNRTSATLSSEEAIASLMLGRLPDLARAELNGQIPVRAQRLTGAFAWQLFQKIQDYIRGAADSDQLLTLATSAKESYERAALYATAATLACEQGNFEGALAALQNVEVDRLPDPVDRAWLRAHEARCLLETGKAPEAQEIALDVAAVGLLHPDDPSALALRAATLNGVFALSGWSAEHFEEMIRANDSAPSWWRGQQRSFALSGYLEEIFHEWAGFQDNAHRRQHEAWCQLRAIVLTTGIAADQRSWQAATAQLAEFELVMDAPRAVEDYGVILRDLRLSGNKNALRSAIRRLHNDGPIGALKFACSQVSLERSTWTSLATDLELLLQGHDAMANTDVERHACWALNAVQDPQQVPETLRPAHVIRPELIELITRLWDRVSFGLQERIRTYVTETSPIAEQTEAERYSELVRRMSTSTWTPQQLDLVRTRLNHPVLTASAGEPGQREPETNAYGDHWVIADTWRWLLAAQGDSRQSDDLFEEAARGNERAILAIGDLSRFPEHIAPPVVKFLSEEIRARLQTAHSGVTFGGLDYGRTLLGMNLAFPGAANWDPIISILNEPNIPEDQHSLLGHLANVADNIPPQYANRLVPPLRHLIEQPPATPITLMAREPIDVLAKRLLFALKNPLDSSEEIVNRLKDGHEGKASVARALGDYGAATDAPLLASLAHAGDPRLRADVAAACTRWILRDQAPDLIRSLLEDLLAEGGTRNAFASLREVGTADSLGEAGPIISSLQTHPSAAVRQGAQALARRG